VQNYKFIMNYEYGIKNYFVTSPHRRYAIVNQSTQCFPDFRVIYKKGSHEEWVDHIRPVSRPERLGTDGTVRMATDMGTDV
jgi:hypothetical protein